MPVPPPPRHTRAPAPLTARALLCLAAASAGLAGSAAPAGAAPPAAAPAAATVTVPSPVPPAIPGDPLGRTLWSLQQRYPDRYGGVSERGTTLVVGEVGRQAGFETSVRAALDGLLPAYRRAGAAVPAEVDVAFTEVEYPLAALESTAALLLRRPALRAPGTVAVGLDVAADRVAELTDGGAAPPEVPPGVEVRALPGAVLQTAVGGADPVPSAHGAGPARCAGATRFLDCSPWNGGDGLSTGIVNCTSGFGVHDTGTGAQYLVTAGHCGAGGIGQWYDTALPGEPYPSGQQYVGATVAGSVATSGVDTMLIAPQSGQSSCIVWGGLSTLPSNAERVYLTGYDDPFAGATVDVEGAVSLERQGTVAYTDVTTTGTDLGESLVDVGLVVPTGVAQPGDSGGPVVFPTVFGPLAGGTVVGSLSYQGGTFAVYQQIDAILYVDSAWAGAPITVNTATGRSSC